MTRRNEKRYWLVGLIFIFVLSCWALQAEEVRVLEGREYFEVLHKALQEAKVGMFGKGSLGWSLFLELRGFI